MFITIIDLISIEQEEDKEFWLEIYPKIGSEEELDISLRGQYRLGLLIALLDIWLEVPEKIVKNGE